MKILCVSDRACIGMEGGPDGKPRLRAARLDERTDLTVGKVYNVIEEDGGFYRVVDDSGADYMHPKNRFRVIEP